ncbi:MAG: fatty acid--CoA ligase family protein, partial [Ekhidna sp.]
ATILTCTPALIKQLIELGSRIQSSLRSLKQVLCTGVNLSPALVSRFEDLFNIRILNYYGLTETSGLCIGETPGNANGYSEGSIGVAIDSIAQIVDEKEKIVDTGNVGRLRIYNDRLMTRYLDTDNKSDLSLKNGWLYTGDLASQDDAGNFYLKGRERNIIKDVAGQVVYISEVENTLLSHESVKDVEISKIVVEEIESLYACILLKPEILASPEVENDIKSFVRQKIGNTKVPTIEFVRALKRNGRGNLEQSKYKLTT